ncbi:MAG: hypothetical protein ACYCW6_25910 [Candidatus Xenobia bacterium]
MQTVFVLALAEQWLLFGETLELPWAPEPREKPSALERLNGERARIAALDPENAAEMEEAFNQAARALPDPEAAIWLREACQTILNQRLAWLWRLQEQGPTIFPPLNRLIHAMRRGAATEAMVQAAREIPDLEWADDADGLAQAGDRLGQTLLPTAEAEARQGPTADPVINVVLQAAQRAWSQEGMLLALARFIGLVQRAAPGAAGQRLEELRQAAAEGDYDGVQAAYQRLETMRVSDEDDMLFLDFTEDGAGGFGSLSAQLPRHFDVMLETVEAYLTNPGQYSETAYHYLGRMRAKIEQIEKAMAKASPTHMFRGPGTAAVIALKAAADHLQEALDHRSRRALDTAREQMTEAAEALKAVTPRR